jgi:hypothetical protein
LIFWIHKRKIELEYEILSAFLKGRSIIPFMSLVPFGRGGEIEYAYFAIIVLKVCTSRKRLWS